jgi:uncharacterized protein
LLVANPVQYVELTTNDLDKAGQFYTKLFAWELEDYPMDDGGTYTIFRPGEGTGGRALRPRR